MTIESGLSTSSWSLRAAVVVLVPLAITIALVSLEWPLAYNHAIYLLQAATHLGLNPGAPESMLDTKGPMSFVPLMPALLATGRSGQALRLTDAVMIALGATGAFRLLRRQADVATSLAAAVALVLFCYGFGFRRTGEPDLWLALLTTLAVSLALRSPTRVWLLALTFGTLSVGGALLKPFYLGTAILPVLGATSRREAIRRALLTATVVAGVGLLSLAILQRSGLLQSWLDVQFGFNLESYSAIGRLTPLDRLRNMAATLLRSLAVPALIWIPALGLALSRFRPLRAPDDRVMLGWLLIGAGYELLQGRRIEYQAFPFLIPAVVLIAEGLRRHVSATIPLHRVVGPVAVALLLVSVSRAPVQEILRVAGARWRHESPAQSLDHLRYLERFSPGDDERMRELVAQVVPPESPIEVWGQNTALLFTAARPPATGFVAWILLSNAAPARLARYRASYFAQFAESRPQAFITSESDTRDASGTHLRSTFPPLADTVAINFVQCQRIGHLTLFLRRQSTESLPSACR